MISKKQSDVIRILPDLLNDIDTQMFNRLTCHFIQDYHVIDVILLSLMNMNFHNHDIVTNTLKCIVKQMPSNYISIVHQLSKDKNMHILLSVIEHSLNTHNTNNVITALHLIHNTSCSSHHHSNTPANAVSDTISKRIA